MSPLYLNETKAITECGPCFIIAEIGQNHQGDVNIAKRLIDAAQESGADCVKFQKSCLKEKFTQAALDQPYDSVHAWGKTYGEHKAHLEFSENQFKELQKYATDRGIMFTASAMDPVSLRFLIALGVPFLKIGSGDSDNLSLVEEAASSRIPLVISTGMQDLEGVKRLTSVVQKYHQQFALLHCVSAYPTPTAEANLRAIATLKDNFPGALVGYSGHEEGYNLTIAAVALGAKIVERHITLDKTWKGNDHKCSLTPSELESLIFAIREVESALGNGIKTFMNCEIPCMNKLGKTVVAGRSMKAAERLKKKDLKIKVSSEQGPRPHEFEDFVGKQLTKDLLEDEVVRWNFVIQ